MSLILSLETSTTVCSVSLHKEGKHIVSQEIHLEKSHSSNLINMVKYALEFSGQSMQDLSAVAISKGPGSYTGLRIGTSTAKGLSFALDIPLIGINTLEAMAYEVSQYKTEEMLLCPMIDARRMEVYHLLLDYDLKIVNKTEALVLNENSFYESLLNRKVLFFGNGSGKLKALLQGNENAVFLSGIYPHAKNIGALAVERFNKGEFEDLAYFEPFYLKDFVGTKPVQK